MQEQCILVYLPTKLVYTRIGDKNIIKFIRFIWGVYHPDKFDGINPFLTEDITRQLLSTMQEKTNI